MVTITEVECSRKAVNSLNEMNKIEYYHGIFVCMQTIVNYLVWIMLFPWTVLVAIFHDRKTQISAVTSEGNIDCDDNHDHDNNYHVDKIVPYQSNSVFHVSCDTLNTSETLFDHVRRVILLQSPCRVPYNPSKTFERIIIDLIWLADNGEYDAFDQLSSFVLYRYSTNTCNPEIVAAVLVEQSRSMLYRNCVARAKALAREALEVSSRTTCPGMFVARACLVMSAIHRRKGRLGKAKACLEKAEQNLINTSYYEDWSRFYDAYGSYLNSFIDTVSNPSPELYKNANETFQRQHQAARRCPRIGVRKKYRFYALLKMARTLLDANTIFGQQRVVSARDVHMAIECLDKIENELWDRIPHGTHIQFLLVRCKQYYRQKRFQKMLELLERCSKMAKASGYERDLDLIVKGAQQVKVLQRIEGGTSADFKTDEKDLASSSEKEFDNISDSIDVFASRLGDSN